MDDHKSEDQHLVAAAQHILKALAASKAVSDDLRKTLLDFDIHLSAMSIVERSIKQLERKIKFAEGKIMTWKAKNSMIWDCGSKESSEYLEAKLEEELVHILVKHKQYLEPESFANEAGSVDLVNPALIPDLKSIANVMFGSKYHQEFCQTFISSRRDALDEFFVVLEIERFSNENVMKMEGNCLNREIKKWIRAVKIVFQVYLVAEKRLCKQILGDFNDSVYQFCFAEITLSFVLKLLNFGEAVAMGNRSPEKLFCFLDIYEVLENLAVYVDILFFEEFGSFVRDEFHKLLNKFGEASKFTFLAFKNAIANDPSKARFPGGGVHHLTKYVMNFIKTLAEYGEALNLLLADETPADPEGNDDDDSHPLAGEFWSVAATLESNLISKSKLYKDVALQHVFMMNNIHYMVQKAKSSELSLVFGDRWLRRHVAKFRDNARSYERVTWGPILSILKQENAELNCTSSKENLKKKCKDFNASFSETYRSQTGWYIPDTELREDVQISISQKVVHAYRQFTGRYSSTIDEKWKKHTVDDIENYVLDLFVGSPKSLHYFSSSAQILKRDKSV
ncbi:exocyst complex component EXO70B1-like [Arachis ipaensis]|uniref:exocyst complex component EXO70B1-like n=1 Tax=Arachis ipaensis TaxID=130454 RepID=UPI0007AF34E3|nr:exocyst complex component EXO70B1-like [Arachis ipaensis]